MASRLLWWGMVFIVLDVRLNSFDLLPDVVGWGLLVLALADLRRRDRRLGLALVVAVFGVVASAVDLALFFSEVQPAVLMVWLWFVEALLWWLVSWWVLVALADAAMGVDAHFAITGRRIAVLVLAVGLADLVAKAVGVLVVVHVGHLLGSFGLIGLAAHLVVYATSVAVMFYALGWALRISPRLPEPA